MPRAGAAVRLVPCPLPPPPPAPRWPQRVEGLQACPSLSPLCCSVGRRVIVSVCDVLAAAPPPGPLARAREHTLQLLRHVSVPDAAGRGRAAARRRAAHRLPPLHAQQLQGRGRPEERRHRLSVGHRCVQGGGGGQPRLPGLCATCLNARARPPPQTHRRCTGLGRSPGGTPGAFSGRGGQGPTPPSITRRRSLTPASSRQMETPPPPPADSLLDSPTGLGAAPPTAWGVEPGGGE